MYYLTIYDKDSEIELRVDQINNMLTGKYILSCSSKLSHRVWGEYVASINIQNITKIGICKILEVETDYIQQPFDGPRKSVEVVHRYEIVFTINNEVSSVKQLQRRMKLRDILN